MEKHYHKFQSSPLFALNSALWHNGAIYAQAHLGEASSLPTRALYNWAGCTLALAHRFSPCMPLPLKNKDTGCGNCAAVWKDTLQALVQWLTNKDTGCGNGAAVWKETLQALVQWLSNKDTGSGNGAAVWKETLQALVQWLTNNDTGCGNGAAVWKAKLQALVQWTTSKARGRQCRLSVLTDSDWMWKKSYVAEFASYMSLNVWYCRSTVKCFMFQSDTYSAATSLKKKAHRRSKHSLRDK